MLDRCDNVIAFVNLAEAFADAAENVKHMPQHVSNRDTYIPIKERARIYRKAISDLGLRKHVSVRTSDYSWVTIKSTQPEWSADSIANNRESVHDLNANINDSLAEIWQHLFPGLRNTIDGMSDYYDIKYSIN